MGGLFNIRLREVRKHKKMTQETLANLLGVGKSTIAGYEKGFRKPKLETINKIAEIFNTSSDYLLGLTNSKTPKEPTKDLDKLLRDTEEEYNFKGQPITNKDLQFLLDYLDRISNIEPNNKNNDKEEFSEDKI